MHKRESARHRERVERLKLEYQDLLGERDRLRSARAAVTSRLGPLPASAAIVIGLVGAVADNVDSGFLIAAAAAFVALVLVSALYSGLPPYRLLRARREAPTAAAPSDLIPWLEYRIAVEQAIYGDRRSRLRLSLRRNIDDLQEGFDVEWTTLIVVQVLFAAIVVVLVVGILMN